MPDERTRRNWKARYEATAELLERARLDLEDARGNIAELEAMDTATSQIIDALKRDVERAKMIGARDLTNVMLNGGNDG